MPAGHANLVGNKRPESVFVSVATRVGGGHDNTDSGTETGARLKTGMDMASPYKKAVQGRFF